MKELMFFNYQFKKNEKNNFHCTYLVNPFPILGVSGENYEEAGKKMIPLLLEECKEKTFKIPFYLTTIKKKFGRNPATPSELKSIKISLEKYLKENNLNIKLLQKIKWQ